MVELTAYNLKKNFLQGEVQLEVLKGITIQFASHLSYAITGQSGSGKSTLMHLLAGLDYPTHGYITFNGEVIADFKEHQRQQFLNNSIGLVFQLPYLISELNVIDNVMLKGMIAGHQYDEMKDQAYQLLKKMGIEHKATYSPCSLSGGEQQRVAIARALYTKPSFLLADEPTGNLDAATGKKIIDLLSECQVEWHMGIIISSHDLYVAERMERVLRLENGLLI